MTDSDLFNKISTIIIQLFCNCTLKNGNSPLSRVCQNKTITYLEKQQLAIQLLLDLYFNKTTNSTFLLHYHCNVTVNNALLVRL